MRKDPMHFNSALLPCLKTDCEFWIDGECFYLHTAGRWDPFQGIFPVSSDPVFIQNIEKKSINHGIGVLKKTVIFGLVTQSPVISQQNANMSFSKMSSDNCEKREYFPDNVQVFLQWTRERWQEPSNNGCHYPYCNSNYQGFEPADRIEVLQSQQPHDSRDQCCYPTCT